MSPQLPRPKKKSAGTRTRTRRPQPPAPRPPRPSDQAPLNLPRPSTHPLPLPRQPCSSRPSPASPTTKGRRRIATQATTSLALARATRAMHPTAPRKRARQTRIVMTIGSNRDAYLLGFGFPPRMRLALIRIDMVWFPSLWRFRWEI